MLHRFLPPLNSKSTLPAPHSAGQWEEHPPLDTLLTLARDIAVTTAQGAVDRATSIPDCWARPMLFRAILADTRDALHSEGVVQWRALIALFSLARLIPGGSLALRTQGVDLAPLARGANAQLLAQVLTRLPPLERLMPDLDWNRPIIVFCGPVVVGMLSPSTLVCPGRVDLTRLERHIPWINQGAWIDPVTAPRLRPRHRRVLLAHVRQLVTAYAELERDPACDADLHQMLMRHLRDYESDLKAQVAKENAAVDTSDLPCSPLDVGITLGSQKTYESLFIIPEKKTGEEEERGSDLVIAARPGLGGRFKGVVLLDPSVANSLHVNVDALACWDDQHLVHVLDNDDLREEVTRSMVARGYLPVTPEDLFKPLLFEFRSGRCESHRGGFENSLLPFSPLVLLLLDAEALRDAVTLRREAGAVLVTLTLPLVDAKGKTRNHTLTKTYPVGQRPALDAPSLGVWPDFQAPGVWTHHYLRYVARLPLQPVPSALLSVDALTQILSALPWTGESDVQRLLQSLEGDLVSRDGTSEWDWHSKREQGDYMDGLFRRATASEAIYCRTTGGAGGLLLLRKLPSAPQRLAEAYLGIDLGSTNTCVAVSKDQATPTILDFQPRVWFPCPGGLDSDRPAAIVNDLMPLVLNRALGAGEDGDPFRSLLRERRGGGEGITLRDAYIPFYSDIWDGVTKLRADGLATPGGGGSDYGLQLDPKWSSNLLVLRSFLSHTLFIAMAELVADGFKPERVKVRYSYPEAHTPEDAQAFRDIVHTSSESLGWNIQFGGIVPETRSSALYFNKKLRRSFADLAITLDVGGRTTDVTIWNNHTLYWTGSLKLGGRDMLVRYLAQKPERLEEELGIVWGEAGRLTQNMKTLVLETRSRPDAPSPLVEAVIESVINDPAYFRTSSQRLSQISATGALASLRKITLVSMAGLLYYIALVIRRLQAQEFKTAFPLAPSRINIVLGGRGASIYKRFLTGGAARSVVDLLHSLMARELKLDKDVFSDFAFSEDSKKEVALGLVWSMFPDTDLDLARIGAGGSGGGVPWHQLVVGEQVSLGRFPPDCPLDANDDRSPLFTVDEVLGNLKGGRALDLAEFQRFLSRTLPSLGYTVPDVGDQDRTLWQGIVDEVNRDFDEQLRKYARISGRDLDASRSSGARTAPEIKKAGDIIRGEALSITVQPPFITALREYLFRLSL